MLYRWLQPSLGLLWAETIGHCDYRQAWIYESDGGHKEGTAHIAAGLRRNARDPTRPLTLLCLA